MSQGLGGFFSEKVANLRSGHRHFVEMFFQKTIFFYIRKIDARTWYFHLLYQKSKKKFILEK